MLSLLSRGMTLKMLRGGAESQAHIENGAFQDWFAHLYINDGILRCNFGPHNIFEKGDIAMKKLLLCLFLLFLAVPADARGGDLVWKEFESRWMKAFTTGSVSVQDQGQVKICTLDEGVTATFFLNADDVVERAVVVNTASSSARYFDGVAQTIKILAGQVPQAEAVSAAFATVQPATLWRAVGGFCFERVQDSDTGWFFYASRSEQCPTEVR